MRMTGSGITIGPAFPMLLATRHALYGWNWQASAQPSVFQYQGEPNAWTQIAGPEFSSVRASHEWLYGLKHDGTVWRYTGTPQGWNQVGQGMLDIEAGGEGVVGTTVATGVGHSSFEAFDETEMTWQPLGGSGQSAVTDGVHYVAVLANLGLALFDPDSHAWTPIGENLFMPAIVGGVLAAATPPNGSPTMAYAGSPGRWSNLSDRGLNLISVATYDGLLIALPGFTGSPTLISKEIAAPAQAWEELYGGEQNLTALAATERGVFASGPQLGTIEVPTRRPPAKPVRGDFTKWTVMVQTADELFAGYDGQITLTLVLDGGLKGAVIPKTHFRGGELYFFDIEVESKLKTLKGLNLFGTENAFDDRWHLAKLTAFNPETSTLYVFDAKTTIGNGPRFGTELGAPTSTYPTSYPPGTAKVYVWDYLGLDVAMGHASISLDDDATHISWWPDGPRRAKLLATAIGFPNHLYCTPARPHQTLADDEAFEAESEAAPPKPPDHTFVVGGLDTDAIRRWWASFQATHEWCTFSQNCSTTVADALWAGGVKSRLSSAQYAYYSAPTWPWTPASAYNFVQAINTSMP
jgi:hypothetical protein